MNQPHLHLTERLIEINLAEASLRIPHLWLRDNEPASFHPQTLERSFDLLSVPADICPINARLENSDLVVQWPDHPEERRYSLDWLQASAPGSRRPDPSAIIPQPWTDNHIPTRIASADMAGDASLLDALKVLKREGLIIVTGLTDEDDGIRLGERIGFKRETNFGLIWDVISKQVPNNQAYTADLLDLHQDLPNQQLMPGYQFLHCIANGAKGGDSLFCDGLKVLNDFRSINPVGWETLRDTAVPYRFRDATCDIRQRRPVFQCDDAGRPVRLAFNPGILDIVDLAPELVEPWYAAWRQFRALLKDHPCRVIDRLAPGEMAVFDNSRLLHGRTPFDPSTGERRLRGYYIDHGEVDSRIRVMTGANLT